MKITWVRTLRTGSSERLLAQVEGREVASADLHFLEGGLISGTVIVLRDSGLKESDVPGLLSDLDKNWLPGADLSKGNLTFTVVLGDVLGNFEAMEEGVAGTR